MRIMVGVMNPCAKCGAVTEGGQFYRFYFGTVVDAPESKSTAEGNHVDPGPLFQLKGAKDVYYCDRCVIQAAVREERMRSGLFLVIGLFAIGVVSLLVLISSPGLWAGLVILL